MSGWFYTSVCFADGTEQKVIPEETWNQTVAYILSSSIRTLREARNYAVDLRCQAQIMGQIFSAKGMYCQKWNEGETVSARLEMEYYMPTFQFYQLSVLNGEKQKLWTLSRRQQINSEETTPSEGILLVDLTEVTRRLNGKTDLPEALRGPWYNQTHIDQILEGILKSCDFTMAGETHFAGTTREIYQIQGVLKPDLVKKILEVRAMNPGLGLVGLPAEVPTCVELLLDKKRGFPIQIRFFRESGSENQEEFQYMISFENTYLNNTTLNPGFFEITPGNVTRDVTEEYLKKPWK